MRSLQLVTHTCAEIDQYKPGSQSRIAIDPENLTIYVAIVSSNDPSSIQFIVIESGLPPVEIARYQSDRDCSIVDFTFLSNQQMTCLSTRGGDILLISKERFDTGEEVVEVVGSVDSGIAAMSWSPDQDIVVLVTGEKNILEMTQDFETIIEDRLHVDFEGEGVQQSVGWGRKETQFHGSEGKEAALRKVDTSSFTLSEDDDNVPRIAWRGDGNFFVCSDVDDRKAARVLRIYNREGVLQNTSEPVDKLEHILDWRPSGNLIVSSQRLPHRHDIVFFERNGLRHGEFTLKVEAPHKLLNISWNADSTVLAISIETENRQKSIQLWTMNNYHWYMKQELVLSKGQNIECFVWDTESPLRAHAMSDTGFYHQYNFSWDVIYSPSTAEDNVAYAAVIDASAVLLTPFTIQNVPPPMCGLQLDVPGNVQQVAFGPDSAGTLLAVLIGRKVAFYQLPCKLPGDVVTFGALTLPTSESHKHSCLDNPIRQLRWISSERIAYLQYDDITQSDKLCLVDFDQTSGDIKDLHVVSIDTCAGRLHNRFCPCELIVESADGTIFRVDLDTLVLKKLFKFPDFCPWIGSSDIGLDGNNPSNVIIGLSDLNKLCANDKLLSSECTSFFLRHDWLVITTTSHTARFLSLKKNEDDFVLSDDVADPNDETSRRVERGSKIVLATQGKSNLILQMPRGNLETIAPRAFVIASIGEDLKNLNFRSAFLTCRRNRIDLNFLYDENPNLFFEHIEQFIEQVPEVDYLNLFLSNLRNEDTTQVMYKRQHQEKTTDVLTVNEGPNKVNKICEAIRDVLFKLGRDHYIQSIISTYVRSSPPDLESALGLITEIRETSMADAEHALQYTIFLCKSDILYDTALGMYNFPLVLMVAQQAQKDPREYIPFLQELQGYETFYQRFKIDDHLKRYDSAIRNLSRADANHFDELILYMKKHNLYLTALEAYSDKPNQKKMLWNAYGDYLDDTSASEEAGIAYSMAGEFYSALNSYRKAGCWREAFSLAKKLQYTKEDTTSLATSIIDSLKDKSHHQDAATVALDYLDDVETAVECLLKGGLYQETLRVSSLHDRLDLIETHIYPGLIEGYTQMDEDLDDMINQFNKQTTRLEELRNKPIEQPLENLPTDDALDNIDMFSDTTSMYSQFSRYTQATSRMSTVSGSSSRRSSSARTKKREERKRARGKKGSVFEEEYLVNSLKRLYERTNTMERDAGNLIRALVPAGYRKEAAALQDKLSSFSDKLKDKLSTIFVPLRLTPQAIATVQGEEASNTPSPVEKPVLTNVQWKLQILQ